MPVVPTLSDFGGDVSHWVVASMLESHDFCRDKLTVMCTSASHDMV